MNSFVIAIVCLLAFTFVSADSAETVNFKVTFDSSVNGSTCRNALATPVPCPNMKMAAIIDGKVTDRVITLHYAGFAEMAGGVETGRALSTIPSDYNVTATDLGDGNKLWTFKASGAGLCGGINCNNTLFHIDTFVSGSNGYTTPRGYKMLSNTLKTAVNVSGWPWGSTGDALRIKFKFTGENIPHLNLKESSTAKQHKLTALTDSADYTFVQLYDKSCLTSSGIDCAIEWNWVDNRNTQGNVMVHVDVPRQNSSWLFYDPEVYNGTASLSLFFVLCLMALFQF